jgi:hypothetical protein
MRRLLLIFGLLFVFAPLAARADHETLPQLGPVPGAIPTLIARYDGNAIHNKVRYLPRQFQAGFNQIADVSWGNWTVVNAGVYSGWDVLPLPNDGLRRALTTYPHATYTLTRPASVAIVWRAETPPADWLAANGWTPASPVTVSNPSRGTKTYPTYTRSLPAGAFAIGGNYDPGDSTAAGAKNLPWVLVAEENAQPSAAPVVPEGNAVPAANTTCPAWAHDRYQAIGPDGSMYRTWHPAIDPVYWCYFRHEHGSDPRHAFPDGDFTPLYGYVASGMTIPGTSTPMTENHWGHKSAAFQNADGYWLYVTQHVGTTGVARANTCLQRFHLVEILVRTAARTETLAHLQFMADYGRSVVSDASTNTHYTPTACPNGNAATGLTSSVPSRRIPLVTTGQLGYEPWQFSQTAYAAMGLTGALTINTQQPLDICGALACDAPVARPLNAGVSRITQPTTTFGIHDPGLSLDGHFCTDGMGMVMDCALPGAIAQFIAPGFSTTIRGTGSLTQTHFETSVWGDALLVSAGGTLDRDPEGSIAETHGPN